MKKDLLINYTKFTIKGKDITRDDVWSFMAKYEAKNPDDKKFKKLMEFGEKIL